jgi:ribonuclease P protein component
MPERQERFPKRERLRGREAFRRVYEQGIAHRGQYMILLVVQRPEFDCQVGFVTSRKVGNAVKRNRARRLLRESYRRLRRARNDEGRHAHLVFVARSTLPQATFSDVQYEMRRLMTSAGVIEDGNTDDDGA